MGPEIAWEGRSPEEQGFHAAGGGPGAPPWPPPTAQVRLFQFARRPDTNVPRAEVYAPIGIAYVEASLARLGVEVRSRLLAPDEVEGVLRQLSGFQGVVGLSATGNEIGQLLDFALRLKVVRPGLVIVAGGYCSLEAERLLESGWVDIVVVGEGEETMAELVPVLARGASPTRVRGLVFREADGRLNRTPVRPPLTDLDRLPLPTYTHFPPNAPLLRVYASRGCPYDCTFCRIKDYYGSPKVRAHGARWMRRLVGRLLAEHPVSPEHLYFNDDEFLLKADHLDAMAGVAREFDLTICFQTRTQDVIRHRAALERHRNIVHEVHMGVESFAQAQLDRWSKRVTVAENGQAIRILVDLGISYYPYLILTDERTTPEEVETNCRGILALPPRPYHVRRNRRRSSAVMHPLHSGLHLNRLKDLHGNVVRSLETSYLEALWHFLDDTYEEADRLSSLSVYSAVEARPGARFVQGERLLEDRIRQAASLTRLAWERGLEEGNETARRAAERFRDESARARALHMAYFTARTGERRCREVVRRRL